MIFLEKAANFCIIHSVTVVYHYHRNQFLITVIKGEAYENKQRIH